MSTAPTAPPRRQPPPPPIRESLRLAAIDIGSNSIHMIVAQADADGGVTTLWRMKEPVGLGRMSFPSRRLSEEAIERAVGVLARFLQAAKLRQAEKIVAVATSAVREASNGGDLIERVKRELGQYVRVVSAREEARLIYLAVRHAMPLGERPHLIVDIGGGSVEFIVGDAKKATILESRKLGAARMSAKFVSTDPIASEQRKGLERHFERELAPLFEQIRKLKPVAVIGTSGTLENVAAMSDGHGETVAIDRKRFDRMLGQLLPRTSDERAQIKGLDDGRKDQIVAGALLVDDVFKRLPDLQRITICGQALREGILLDYLSRHIPDLAIRRDVPDPRRRSVLDLARRSDWHQTHSEHVATLCLKLFDQLRALHGLGNSDRELIEFAAMLHDIGWHIGNKGHHKHSMYLIANGQLKGFTPEEIQIIANIARYHRKSTPKESHGRYGKLSRHGKRVVDVGCALLRIADGLDRSHASVIQSIHCRLGEKKVSCTLSARSDAELEVWGARRKMQWFNKVFDRRLTIELA